METSTAVATKSPLGSLQGLLEKYKHQIAMALPRHLTPERMIRVAITAVSRTPKLMECDQLTVAGCIVQASILGLEPNGMTGEAYLVPFFNGKTKRMECQLIPGYLGLVRLARNSGEFSVIDAQPVHERDEFDFEKGSEVWWRHKWPKTGDRGAVIGYWAGYVLKDGGKNFEYMTVEQIISHRDRYSKGAFDKAGNLQGPWKDSPDWMFRKTPLKQVLKLAPKSTELATAISLSEQGEAGMSQALSVDVPYELQAPAQAALDMPRRKSDTEDAGSGTQHDA